MVDSLDLELGTKVFGDLFFALELTLTPLLVGTTPSDWLVSLILPWVAEVSMPECFYVSRVGLGKS
jgi:hypothetical protein